MRRLSRWTGSCLLMALAAGASAESDGGRAGEEPPPEEIEQRLDRLVEDNRRLEHAVEELQEEVRRAREAAAEGGAPPPAEPPAAPVSALDTALWSRQVGTANFQLLDISVDVLTAAGTSTADDDEIQLLEGGGHDPRQRGFTLQQVELSFQGAVDPYITGEVHLIYFLDPENESQFEIEEAFLQSIALPFGLDDAGFQIEAGTFFTEFGRINPQHPHQWDWQDQPFILTRLFGADGIRGPGVRVGWLLPLLPWNAELSLGMQNSQGETMVSFRANDEVFEERAIGGRPFADPRVGSLEDFTYLVRLANGFDVTDTITAVLGGSTLFGPNGTGNSGRTEIYGTDLLVKWVPLDASRGWPFVKLESELLYRRYQADAYFGPFQDAPDDVFLPHDTLDDYGLYVQTLWGFFPRWAVGLRYEYGNGSGADVAFDTDTDAVVPAPRSLDPYRSRRHRVSPLLAFYPSHFSRLRLQYNYDNITFASDPNVHSVWFGVEFLFGAHPAHML